MKHSDLPFAGLLKTPVAPREDFILGTQTVTEVKKEQTDQDKSRRRRVTFGTETVTKSGGEATDSDKNNRRGTSRHPH